MCIYIKLYVTYVYIHIYRERYIRTYIERIHIYTYRERKIYTCP